MTNTLELILDRLKSQDGKLEKIYDTLAIIGAHKEMIINLQQQNAVLFKAKDFHDKEIKELKKENAELKIQLAEKTAPVKGVVVQQRMIWGTIVTASVGAIIKILTGV